MGIALGHVYLLMEEFSSRNPQNKATLLQNLIQDAKTSKDSKQLQSNKNNKVKTINAILNWYNYNWKKLKYSLVKELQGGGRRALALPLSSTMNDVLINAKKLFFPDEKNMKGNIYDFEVSLCDFKMSEFTTAEFDKTVKEYRDEHRLSHKETRFILKTKQFGKFKRLENAHNHSKLSTNDDVDDGFIPKKQ
eukprot:TCONS_00033766-protein